ncbi:MAG: DUF86 domain-containing protein [Actinobacteria bacterium]|nr:DUF86 domain-containing protein [Actinomycetota bacterium]
MRTDRERLIDILDAIDKIEEQTGLGEERFRSDEMVQVWVVYHLQIIGEAAARLSQALKTNSPGVPWADIVGMRNIVVHEYFGLDLDRIWSTVTSSLKPLREEIELLLPAL